MRAVDRLPVNVVIGVAGDVLLGGLGQGENAEGDQGGGGDRQSAIHIGQAEALGDAGMDGEWLGPGAARAGGVHQPGLPPLGPADAVACL